MNAFWSYFLGKGTEVEFVNFSFAHFAPILLMVALILLSYRFRDRLRAWRHEEILRYIMA